MDDLAWLAGYFEGEGTLSITSSGRRGYTRPWVTLASVDPAPIHLFNERWRGYLHVAQPKKGRARPAHVWTISTRPIIRQFLMDMWPYWKTDRVRNKAVLLLEDIDARVQGIKDPAYLIACHERRGRMRVLNQRGAMPPLLPMLETSEAS